MSRLPGKFLGDIFEQEILGTGNGATTVFALTSTPHSKKAIEVTLDGLLVDQADFSLGGLNITFTTAPGAGQVVAARYFKK